LRTEKRKKIGEIAIELGFLKESDLICALSHQLSVPCFSSQDRRVDRRVLGLIPASFSLQNDLLPFGLDSGSLNAAMTEPNNHRILLETAILSGQSISPYLCSKKELECMIPRFYQVDRLAIGCSYDYLIFAKSIGEHLVSMGRLTLTDLMRAFQISETIGAPLDSVLIENGTTTEQDWLEVMNLRLGISPVSLEGWRIDAKLARTFSPGLMLYYSFFPIARSKNEITVAMADPQDPFIRDLIAWKTGCEVVPLLASRSSVLGTVKNHFPVIEFPKVNRPPLSERRLGEYLIEFGYLTPSNIDDLLKIQQEGHGCFDRGNRSVPKVEDYFSELNAMINAIPYDNLYAIIQALLNAYNSGKKVIIMGNGGSAATASHFACDLAKGTVGLNFRRFQVMSLADNIPQLTAWSNDTHYVFAFAEQLRNVMAEGDVVIGISGSGNSKNILYGINYARNHGGKTIGICGFTGGELEKCSEISLVTAGRSMAMCEDVHLAICHAITDYLRKYLINLSRSKQRHL